MMSLPLFHIAAVAFDNVPSIWGLQFPFLYWHQKRFSECEDGVFQSVIVRVGCHCRDGQCQCEHGGHCQSLQSRGCQMSFNDYWHSAAPLAVYLKPGRPVGRGGLSWAGVFATHTASCWIHGLRLTHKDNRRLAFSQAIYFPCLFTGETRLAKKAQMCQRDNRKSGLI